MVNFWEHFYLSVPRRGYHWLPDKCLDGPAFLAIQHEGCMMESSHNISDTPPQLVDVRNGGRVHIILDIAP
jgi:hypothetical protein